MINKREVLIIGGVEIAAGVLETIIIPNLGKKKGEKFIWPNKTGMLSSVVVLTGTGIASGLMADYIMDRLNLDESQRMKRVAVIAGTAIAFNVVEALCIDNIIHHRHAIENWKLPTLKKFASNLSLFAIMGLGVGFFSDQLIAATAPLNNNLASGKEMPSDVLADKSTVEAAQPIGQ